MRVPGPRSARAARAARRTRRDAAPRNSMVVCARKEYGMMRNNRRRFLRETIAMATVGDDGSDEAGEGFVPSKELGGMTGGWMGGELGLKTEEGYEKAMSETMKAVNATPPEQLETTKTKYKKEPSERDPEKRLSVGKDFGGMAGGWPLGEVGLKTDEGRDAVSSGRTKEYGGQTSENNLGVYLPLAVVSFGITAALMAFFFQIDIGALTNQLQSAGSDAPPGTGAGAGTVLRSVVAQSSSNRTLVVGGGALASVLMMQLVTSAISSSVTSFRMKLEDNVKVGALLIVGMALAYKILSE